MQKGGRLKFLDSRYALREVEVAIGYDCRRLDDGRRAVFRHTPIHTRARMDFLDRRDLSDVAKSSYLAIAALASNPRMDAGVSQNVIQSARESCLRTLFPYVKLEAKNKMNKYEDYEEYFDELDRIEKEKNEKQEAVEEKEGAPVGSQPTK